MRHFKCLLIAIAFLVALPILAQPKETGQVDVSYFYGNIYKHKDDISHVISGHPSGILVSYNFATYGEKEWQRAFNYPDYGFSFQYQDLASPVLGKMTAVGAHYNFYFFKRQLMFRISQGIAMTSNPYDKQTNFKNNAFGSKFMSSNLFLLNYKRENLIGRIGVQAGFVFTHFSNGRIKSPNSGINTFGVNLGLNYNLNEPLERLSDSVSATVKFSEPIKLNLAFRTGISESPVAHSGQKPFYHFGFYADKRIGRKSALQLGTDVFLTQYLKDYIKFKSVAFPDEPPVDPNTDYKRASVFVGHELFINKLSIETQVGYYFYKPFKYEIDVYQRVGMKYYISKKWFAAVSLKSHAARAEAIEIGGGIRL